MFITVRGYWGKSWAYARGHNSYTSSSISICHLNIRSLRNKIDDIVHIVEDFDIVCFTETHLDQRVPINNLVIPGFNSNPFRLDRNTYGGGIMVYFKNNINIVPRTDLQVDRMEAMQFEIKSKVGNIWLNIIYRSQIFLLFSLLFFHIFHIISQFNLLFFLIFHIFSLFNLGFFHTFHIFSLFNLHFFHIFSIFSVFNLLFLLYFPNLFTMQLAFLHFLLPHLHNSLNDIPNIFKF